MENVKFIPTNCFYKNPVGAVLKNSNISINIGINKDFQIYDLKLLLHKDYENNEMEYHLEFANQDGNYNYFHLDFKINDIGIYWYCFSFCDCYGKHYISYGDSLEGGLSDKKSCWQLSVHDSFCGNLDWYKGKVMYQIMVDRFKNGGVNYKKKNIIFHNDWNEIPNYLPVNGEILNNDFFGGDLLGVIEKLDYLKELNVGVIFLNPIFEAFSNHKYDTANYMKIDPMFGDDDIFKKLCEEADKRGIHIILDGVFNHTGSDSIYFNKNNTYDSIGAYQSKTSPYYEWYYFRKYPDEYDCWWNFLTLPKTNQENESFINYITSENGVINKWLKLGAKGYRLDVVDEYKDSFIQRIYSSVKKSDDDNILIGEVWEDASNKIAYSNRKSYFSGHQLDSVMNYPFRTAIIDFIKNQNIYGFRNSIRSIINNYPKHVLDNLMNMLSTHDTIRILNAFLDFDYYYLSKEEQANYKIPQDIYYIARQKEKIASAIQFTLPGIPCIYYGDEAGVDGFKDPFCRKTMPWDRIDTNLLNWYQQLGKIRKDSIFIDGVYLEEICENNVFAYSRNKDERKIIVIINNSDYDYQYNIEKCYDLLGETEVNNYFIVNKKDVAILKIEK